MSFSYSFDEERFDGDYATREEALAEAVAEGSDRPCIWVGENVPPTQPEYRWHAEDWLEYVSCQDDYSGEWAEGWDDSTKEQRAELEDQVRQVMADWLDKHKLRPRHYTVTNIVEHDAAGKLIGG